MIKQMTARFQSLALTSVSVRVSIPVKDIVTTATLNNIKQAKQKNQPNQMKLT